MDTKLWLLLFFWIAYCVVHSLMAGRWFKKHIAKIMGTGYKYYRPSYSFFALISLIILLCFQYTLHSSWLFRSKYSYIPGVVIGLTGMIIMIICINKYFYELSGLQAIENANVKNTLQQRGIHSYVRHPLYLGTLLFIWGIFLFLPLVSNLIAAACITVYTLFGIHLEEKKLKLEYGKLYREYARKVPMLIPRLKM